MRLLFILLVNLMISGAVQADSQRVLVQSTTSTQNSGLYDYLLPIFEAETGLNVDVVAVGTGQAIRNARNGDADLLLVHAREAEEAFVADGHGLERLRLMYNEFVLIGPADDPAKLGDADDVSAAFRALAEGRAPFVSRGDESGTHKKESGLWQVAGLNPNGSWYRETGAGMGATLRTSVEMQAYTLSDRATWIAFQGKEDHRVVFEGDAALFNQYSVIQLDSARHSHVNAAGARLLSDWLRGPRGQELIAGFELHGQQLFFPNAD